MKSTICLTALLLVACATSTDKPKPAELVANVPKLTVRTAWVGKINTVNFPLNIAVASENNDNNAIINVASDDGLIVSFSVATGIELWRAQAGKNLAAGVGAEGTTAAVVTQANELITFEKGRETWRQKISTSSFTAPLVYDGKVFVLGSDRSISAFNLADGGKLVWCKQAVGIEGVQGDDRSLFGSESDGKVVAWNNTNGERLWVAD